MKLNQVMVFAKDMPRMRTFYRDVIGLVPVDETEADQWLRFDAGGCFLALHAIPAAIAKDIEITQPPQARSDTPIKLTFHADDVDAARARLIAHGAQMLEVRRFGSLSLCDGLDPEGNVFQISNR